jgi:hypothetical protein
VRGRVGPQSVCNRFQYAIQIADDFVVPESQNSIIIFEQPAIACLVPLVVGVLTAIDFYDQTLFTAGKVRDEPAYWLLPHEFVTLKRPGA